jgi:hypothetical protein
VNDVRVEPQLTEHLRAIWLYRFWIVGAALLAAVSVYAIRSSTEPSFGAATVVRVSIRDASGLIHDDSAIQFAAETYSELVDSPATVARALEISGLALTVDDARSLVASRTADTAGFFTIEAKGGSGPEAAALADALGTAVIEVMAADQAAEIEEPTSADTGESPGVVPVTQVEGEVVEPADPSGISVGARPAREAVMAFLLVAIIVAEGFAITRHLRGGISISEPAAEVAILLDTPTVSIPRARRKGSVASSPLLTFFLRHLADQPVITVVQRVGPPSAEGAILVADAAAAVGRTTLLVDTDITSPVMHDQTGLPQSPGLAEVVRGEEPIDTALHGEALGVEPIVLSAGSRRDDSPTLRMPALRHTVIDIGAQTTVVSSTTAATPDEQLLVIQQFPGAVVAVLDPRRTTRNQARAMAQNVQAMDRQLDAVILTRLRPPPRRWRPWSTRRRADTVVAATPGDTD